MTAPATNLSRTSPRAVAGLVREALLTSGAVLGVLCLVLTAASAVAGVKPLVFRSGSMSPAIHTGDLGMSRTVEASTLRQGDVVSVIASGGERVTHRVVNIAQQGDAWQLTLRGDANRVPDREVYTVTTAEKVMFHVPKAGYVVSAATSTGGVFVLGLFVAGMLVLVLRREPSDGSGDDPPAGPVPRGGRRRATKPERAKTAGRVAIVGVLAGALGAASPAGAAPWTDGVTVGGTTLATYTVPKPAITGCTVTGGLGLQKTATITFTEVSSPFALDYTATIVETGTSVTVVDDGATRHVDFSAGLLSTVLNATYTVRIQAKLPAPNGAWVSVVANQPVTISLLGLGLSCGTAS